MTSKRMTLLAGGAGALAAYLFDPAMGRSRRVQIAARTAGLARRAGRRTGRMGRRVVSDAAGIARRMTPRTIPREMDDVTVAERIRSDALRELNRSHINVNVENGVAVLRGSLDDERLAEVLERRVRRIPGVRDVRNMIHTNDAVGM